MPRPGMPARRPCRPSPIRVHHWVSTPFGSHVRVRASSCPVSSHPVSSRPVSARRRPAGWCPRVRPITSVSSASARRWPWRSRRCGGQSSQQGRIELPVVGGVPSGLVGRRVGLEGDGGEVVGGRWGSGDRGPGRVRPGPRLRSRSTADRPGRPVRREVAGGCRLSQAWEHGSKRGGPGPGVVASRPRA